MPEVLTPQQLADRWGTNERSLAEMRYRGNGPAYIKPTAKTVVYRLDDVVAHENARRYVRTDTPAPAA